MFYECYSLTSVVIPEGVTSIGNYAFNSCRSLTSVVIPEGVTSISRYIFANCHACKTYDFSAAASIPSLASTDAFSDINGICKILVPSALYSTWIAATNWSTYANYIVAV